MYSDADVAAFRSFVDARLGRLRPFWFPAFESDLSLLDDLDFANQIRIQTVGYAASIFPLGNPRRHFYIQDRSSLTTLIQGATAAVDNGDGSETITLGGASSFFAPAAHVLATFLRLCRLAEDVQKIHWPGGRSYAFADVAFIELPLEVPDVVITSVSDSGLTMVEDAVLPIGG